MRIAILDQSETSWSAGEVFTRMQLACMKIARRDSNEWIFLRRNTSLQAPPWFTTIDLPDRNWAPPMVEFIRSYKIDVVFPLRDLGGSDISCATIGWIADFQHIHLPELFSVEQKKLRDELFGEMARSCDKVLFSSHAVAADFKLLHGEWEKKSAVNQFPSLLWLEKTSENPESTVNFYNLPKKFLLCINQFWKHKNHMLLPGAIARASKDFSDIHLVLVGQLGDYRDASNGNLSDLMQEIAIQRAPITILGRLDRSKMLDLLRCSAGILQPSLCEGWSTTIEDAKALGIPVLCSDLPVHREQIPSGFFFDPKSAESLARVLSQAWLGLQAGPRLLEEEKALSIARLAAEHYGVACQKICEEAKAEWQNRIQERLKIIKNSPYFNVSQIGELWIVVGELLRLVNRGCSVPGNPTLSPISLEAFEKTLPNRVVAFRSLWAKIGRTLSILPQNFHS
jgi:glycosyltransferase involved in cell wall biosynthesis